MTTAGGSRWPVRAVLAVGVLLGVGYVVETVLTSPFQFGVASDVYYYATLDALDGGSVYDVAPPGREGYTYLYPPVALGLFLPHVLLGSPVAAYVLQTLVTLAVASALAVVVIRDLERRGIVLQDLDRGLLVAFAVAGVWTSSQLVQGQVTVWLGLAVAVGIAAVDRGDQRRAGLAFGAAALVKVFPAALGLWLLRQRAWRATAVAIGTGLAGLLVGALAFGPDLTITYLTEVLVGRYDYATFGAQPDPERTLTTARRQVGVLLGLDGTARTVVTGVVLAPLLAVSYRCVDTDARRLGAVLATLVATLLFMPLQSLYFALLTYPVLVLAFVLSAGWPRRLLLVGTLLTFVSPDPSVAAAAVQPLPASVGGPIVDAVTALFATIRSPTAGMWCLLLAAVALQVPDAAGADRAD